MRNNTIPLHYYCPICQKWYSFKRNSEATKHRENHQVKEVKNQEIQDETGNYFTGTA